MVHVQSRREEVADMTYFVRSFLLFVVLIDAGLLVIASPCSKETRTNNMAACLSAIKDSLLDPTLFWFGNEYSTRCPGGPMSNMLCMNPKPSATTIAARLFSNTASAQRVDRFIEMHFRSEGKNYTACGNTYNSNETWSMDTDPTSDTIVQPWYVRHFPVSVNWDYTEGDHFTLMIYDVGYMVSHGIYTNIAGDDMSTAEVIKEYHGPLSTTDVHNPYTFMLFKQNGRVSVSEEWKQKVHSENWGGSWTIDEFVSAVNLQEMVAVNWIVSTGDDYGAKIMMDLRTLVMCPAFVTKALHEKPRPFIPDKTMLSVWMDLEFMSDGGMLEVCCHTYRYESRNFSLNPIGNPIFNTYEVRTGTPYKLSLMKMGIYNLAKNFSGDMYTLITVDPDVPFPSFGTEERPLLHGLVVNIMNGDISTGEVGLSYQGPAPPDNKPHFYYFLLYKQTAQVNVTKMLNYAGDSCGGRCLYNINLAVQENNLELVGATWMRANTDEYVIYRNIQRGSSEDEQCQGQPGYDNPCPFQKNTCSAENRTRDMHSCIKAINSMMFDTSRFWFGDHYATQCPNGNADGLLCTNPSPTGTSIATRLFFSMTALQGIAIDRFLELHFESTGKNYEACGNTFKTTEVWRYDVDPTSDTIVYPWFVKNFPIHVSWQYEAGDYFTMFVYDLGYRVTHGVYTNILGNDMMSADDIKPYHGPLITTDLHNPYVFLLYKQTGRITVSEDWKNTIQAQNWVESWKIEDFASEYNLTGPVAINWIVATGDEWAAKTMMSRQVLSMCPVFVTRALHEKPRPFIPSDTSLTVWINVTFTTNPQSYTVCCKDYTYTARSLSLNPIGNPIYKSWDVSTETSYSVSFSKLGAYIESKNFTGDWYALITLDPDVPSSTVGTEERPLLHGLITNIRDGNFETGDVGRPYSGPTPPDFKPHYYYMLLYKQQYSLNATEMLNYADSSCTGGLVGRCLFDINRLVSENNLTLVGATWLRSTTDDYVLYRQIQRAGSDEAEICKSQPGYIDPTCPVDSTVALAPSFITFYIICISFTKVSFAY